MDNKEFFQLTTKAVNTINNDARTGGSQGVVKDILERYNLTLDNIKTYQEDIDYRGVFLGIYYTLNRVAQAIREVDPEDTERYEYAIGETYIEKIMRKANILDEYAIVRITEEKFNEVHRKYNIKR